MISAPALAEFHRLEWVREEITLGDSESRVVKERRCRSCNLPAVLMNMGPADCWTCSMGRCGWSSRPPSGSMICYKNSQKHLCSQLRFIIVKGSSLNLAKRKGSQAGFLRHQAWASSHLSQGAVQTMFNLPVMREYTYGVLSNREAHPVLCVQFHWRVDYVGMEHPCS